MRLREFDEKERLIKANEKLKQYKTDAGADAAAADAEGNFARGHKRFKGINAATKKQFDNDAKLAKLKDPNKKGVSEGSLNEFQDVTGKYGHGEEESKDNYDIFISHLYDILVKNGFMKERLADVFHNTDKQVQVEVEEQSGNSDIADITIQRLIWDRAARGQQGQMRNGVVSVLVPGKSRSFTVDLSSDWEMSKAIKQVISTVKEAMTQGVAEGSALSTSTLTGEIPTLMGHRKTEQRDLIEKYALHNREQDYFELFVELSGKPMSEIYNMNDSHQLAYELYNLGSQIAGDWRNISNPTFSRREYLNQIMSDWYNLFKKSIQKYKSMEQGVAEGLPGSLSKSDYTPGATVKNPNTSCKRCNGRGTLWKAPDGKILPANDVPGAKKYKCGACDGIGMAKKEVDEGNEWQGNRGNSQAGITDHTFDEAKQYIKGNYPLHKTYNVSRVEPGMRYHANPEKVANKTQSLVKGIDSALDYLQVKQNPMMSGSTQVTPSIGYSWHTHESRANGIAVLYYEDRGMGNDTITIAAKDQNNLKGAVQVCRDAGVIPTPKVKDQGVAEGTGQVEAYGYRYNNRDQRVVWRKNFSSSEAAHAWADKNNATVIGVRAAEKAVDKSLNEFAPGSSGGESGRWYTDDLMTDIVGDGWWQDMDVSGANIGVIDSEVPKEYMIQQAQAWLDDQGYSVQVLNCKVNDDDMEWYIEGTFQNSGFAKKGVAEATGDEKFDTMMSRMQKEPTIPDPQMPPTDVKDLYQWAVKNNKPYHKIFAEWANRQGYKSVAPALQKAGNLDTDALDYWTPEVWKIYWGEVRGIDSEMPRHWSKERVPDELRDYLETVFDAYENIWQDWPTEYRQIGQQGVAEAENKGLYYNVNKRKAAGTSRPASSPKAPTAQAWKDAAKTAQKEDVAEDQLDELSKDTLKNYVRAQPARIKGPAGLATTDNKKAARIVDRDIPRAMDKYKDPEYGHQQRRLPEDSLAAMRRLAGVSTPAPVSVPNGQRQYRHMPTAVQPR